MKKAALLLAFLILSALPAVAGEFKVKASRDVWVSSYTGRKPEQNERDDNMGAAQKIKLKMWQEFGIIDFDLSKLKGEIVTEAYLYVKPVGKMKFGLNGGISDLKWLSVSTVSHGWVEGKSAHYGKDAEGHGATFNESSYLKADWGFPGSKVWDVILGNGNTVRYDGQLEPDGKWLKIRIDPRIVQAQLAGASHGLMLLDGSAHTLNENYIASRESGNPAFLRIITAKKKDNTTPLAPLDLRAVPDQNMAGADFGALTLTFTVPADAFSYDVSIDGKKIDRWQIPFADMAGVTQRFTIERLAPGKAVTVQLVVVDCAGNRSEPVSVSTVTSPALSVPKLSAPYFTPVAGEPKPLGKTAAVWAFPEITKVDPVDGTVRHEQVPADFKKKNAVYSGDTGTIRLAAAKGEIISFQVAVEGQAKDCSLQISSLTGRYNQTISNSGVKLWRNWYVGRESEYAIPLNAGDTFSVPMPDNKIAGQTLQAITVDYHIPTTTAPGQYTGTVSVTSGGARVKLPLVIKVYNVTIPDEIHFNPELNCYSGPGKAGSDKFKDTFRLAHYNRCTINRVPYHQGGRLDSDWSPDIDSSGRVTDWTRFDNNLGGLLDGSWFKDNPRSGVPVPTIYLPMFEGWPLDFRKYYDPGDGVPMETKNYENLIKHYGTAKPIENSLSEDYRKVWMRTVSDFYRHFAEKGWYNTIAECYLNNKPKYGYTIWTLDEPIMLIDWRALNFFAKMWKTAINDPAVYTLKWHCELYRMGLSGMKRSRPTFLFRADISRMPWQGSLSDGLITLIHLAGGALDAPKIVKDSKVRMPVEMRAYGSCNNVDASNWESAAWCLKVFSQGEDGVLPWQSLGKADSLTKPNKLGLIIDTGDKFGYAIASYRVHALRRGAQDCELLRLLQLSRGWSREHIGMLVSQKIPLSAQFKQKFFDDAGALTFGTLTSQGFAEMKEGVLKLIEQSPGYKQSGIFDAVE